ncbi:hypothetical protein [Kitasatospora sp. NPDC002040]|uniref:hypothetical protein n=1 Tax=Kitasatospora sp. NPDC002040 TaxID=3154661 RepID=UPI00331CC2E8
MGQFRSVCLTGLAEFLGLDTATLAKALSAALPGYIHSMSPDGELVETLAEAPLDEAELEG